jgi:putative ATP-binding cassette transporter
MRIYTAANVSAERIEQLETAIDRHVRPMARRRGEELVIRNAPFRDITFQDVQFDYLNSEGRKSFRLGPVNLVIAPGETIFISGGNGSGKSTFLRLLTSLYFPTRGNVQLDGQRLSESNAATYRELFGVIFYDYHLFDRLYGLRNIDEEQVDALLHRFRLADKTRLEGDRFETLDLSTGQRRRLALVVNYLENKPICVFDEWAAEQEPDFRRYFYTNILPELKAQGKTVIAVTHDDRYYDMNYIDRVIKFEEGKLVVPLRQPIQYE